MSPKPSVQRRDDALQNRELQRRSGRPDLAHRQLVLLLDAQEECGEALFARTGSRPHRETRGPGRRPAPQASPTRRHTAGSRAPQVGSV